MPRALAIVCALLLLTVGGLVWWVSRDTTSPPVAPAPAAASAPANNSDSPTTASAPPRTVPGKFFATPENSRPAQVLPDGKRIVAHVTEAARQLHTTDATPQQDLETLQTLIGFYQRSNGGAVPSGSENEEIVAQLRGENPRKLAVIPPDHASIDSRGRLLDRWNTPYFFHPISRTVMEVRSAGPDARLWTKDDVALPPEDR